MKRKRVEYQKYIRTKLEQESYRELFGITDNITLEGEEDLVLQREFRIDFDTQATQSKDFVLQKIYATIPIIGIFSHFKHYNILEFKSYNDPLTAILLTKYIGQLFWWLYAKRQDAQKSKSLDIRGDEVTLNIITVGRPQNVINELDELLGKQFIRHGGGHYQCNVMGVELHIFVINEFPISREYYAWLVFSEGKQYEKFKEKLAQEIKEDEKYQIYLELINELEKEGSEKMAYEILRKILREMPLEQKQKAVSPDILKSILSGMPTEQKQEVISSDILKGILSDMPADILKGILSDMPVEQKQETIRDVLDRMSKDELQKMQLEIDSRLQEKIG